jgi:hypothetical protein
MDLGHLFRRLEQPMGRPEGQAHRASSSLEFAPESPVQQQGRPLGKPPAKSLDPLLPTSGSLHPVLSRRRLLSRHALAGKRPFPRTPRARPRRASL